MKKLQTKILCMKNHDLTVDEEICIPSLQYPNAPEYGYHDFFEMELYLSGRGLHYLNAIPYEVRPGYAYLLLPGDFHRYEMDASESMQILNIKIAQHRMPSRLLEAVKRAEHPIAVYLEGEALVRMESEVRFLSDVLSQKPSDPYLCDNIVERILLLLLRALPPSGVRTPSPVSSTVVRAAVHYLGEHYHEPITQEKLARTVGLSTNYFGSYFKAETGLSVREYLTRVRLCRGAELLKSTRMKVVEIADRAGFGSPEYFTRIFRENFGMTPRQYRESLSE